MRISRARAREIRIRLAEREAGSGKREAGSGKREAGGGQRATWAATSSAASSGEPNCVSSTHARLR